MVDYQEKSSQKGKIRTVSTEIIKKKYKMFSKH